MKKQTLVITLAFAAATTLAACTSDPQTNRDINCAGGVLGGAAVGGLLGNQVGGGSGRAIATAVGAGAGAAVGTQREVCR
jgi:uncharacterized protein YcfJ